MAQVREFVLAFPEAFDDRAVFYAVRACLAPHRTEDPRWAGVYAWLKGPEGMACRVRHDRYRFAHAADYEPGSYGTDGGAWACDFYRIGDGHHRSARLESPPWRPFYTASELDAFDAAGV